MNIQKEMLAAMLLLIVSFAQAQTVEYIHTDALGSPVAVTNASGAVIERTVYEPYGAVINRPVTNGPGYTGHVMDAVTGLNYMQQRYYDPQVGRFLSNDPVTATSAGANFNRYRYANNNPYRFVDPDGRQAGQTDCRSPFVKCYGGSQEGGGSGGSQTSSASSTASGTNGAWEPPMEEPLRGGFSDLLRQVLEWSSPPGMRCGENVNCLTFPMWGTPRGGGGWMMAVESMPARAAAYQVQITGRAGQVYVLNGVKFDGFAKGILLEAKGPGYANFVRNGAFKAWWGGADDFVAQAQRQLAAAGGTPIQWHFAEVAAADAARALFQQRGIKGIEILVTP